MCSAHSPAVSGEIVIEAVLQRGLCETPCPGERGLLHLAGHRGVTPHPGTQQLHHRCIGHREGALGAIGLKDRDMQVAAVAGGIEIVDLKRTWRYRGFQDGVAILGDDDARIGACNSMHYGRVFEQGIRQHLIIGRQRYPTESEAVEHGAIGEAVTDCQVTADRRDVVSEVGGDVLVAGGLVRGDLERGSLAQVPAAEVDSHRQVQVADGHGQLRGCGAIAVQVVAECGRGHTAVPELRAYIAARFVQHRSLGDSDVEPQLRQVECHGGIRDHRRQIHAAPRLCVLEQGTRRGRQLLEIQPDTSDQRALDARQGDIAVGLGNEANRGMPHPFAVDLQVDRVVPWKHRVAPREA